LLFGPPGTSKTALVKAIAQKLGWPLIMIDPSHFLREGLENIYSEADKVFDDLLDLAGVVVLFDEMDGLVRTRDEDDGNSLDITSRFLTTSMLPKLTGLHDEKRIVFFMATNYQGQFDAAIKRPGRFDLLMCMWPPSWNNKLKKLGVFAGKKLSDAKLKKCQKKLRELSTPRATRAILNRFTFGETMTFFENLCEGSNNLYDALRGLTKDEFVSQVEKWGKTIALNDIPREKKDDDLTPLKRYNLERKISSLQ
jgi:SpoVK/Ycf46/Vps4 family AAA+-type ATPase